MMELIQKSMKITSLLIAGVGFVSLNAIAPASYAGIADDLSNASVSVLSKLGYDCKTASAGGILCTKCKVDDNKQKCEAFTCDVVTKKCRRKTAEIPRIPNLNNNNDESDSNDLPKLPSL
ncbi:MAG: hypothetical protein RLZZ499_652 [Cyanobacteriota bacterium]